MAGKIVTVVQRMIEESDRDQAKIEQTNDPKEKGDLFMHSLKLRSDAANLLNNYRQVNQETTGSAILEKLYEILESLYKDYGGSSTAKGRERGDQLSKLALELVRTVPDIDSIKYRARLLELEWDRQNFVEIISRGKDLLDASWSVSNQENYDAVRYIALAFFENLPVQRYNPSEFRLPQTSFPETMDELLGKLNSQQPDDIEIAKRYAEFIVSVINMKTGEPRKNFYDSASDMLIRDKNPQERLALARNRIDDMVHRNKDNPDAYLARFHFNMQFDPPSEALDYANPDLVTVLALDPTNAEGLILSSLDALRQADIAAKNNEKDREADWQNKAEEYLRRTVRDNPNDPFGYQYLGDFLLFAKGKQMEAIDVWNRGLKNSNHRGDEELIGRLVMTLLDQKMVDEVREKLEYLSRTIAEMWFSRPKEVERTDRMRIMLTAQLYNTEANIAAAKIEAAQRENRPEEVKRLYSIVQQKQGDAIQEFDKLLRTFGMTLDDYILEKKSVYNLLLPQSLMRVGELKLEWGELDSAISYFTRASRFDVARKPALLARSVAYQRGGQLDMAAQTLKEVSDAAPEDLSVRYAYAMVLFRAQVASNSTDPAALDIVQGELEALDSRRSELSQPWVLDMRLIHLGLARANLSNVADTILEAMNDAIRKFRILEKGTFPPDEAGNEKKYIDDPAFVSEMVGIYSSLAARSDFDRLLQILREFPDGEAAYYEARINDCLRRDDKEGAVAIIDEATESNRLSDARKDRFFALLQTLKGENIGITSTLDKGYNQLKTTFDQNPETLKPQAFFLLANMSLDRSEFEQAKKIKERLEKIEGSGGTMWRYIEVRIMLGEKDPDYAEMRRIQEEIARFRPDWDMAHILRAMIEERYLEANPGDTDVRDTLIIAYRAATRCGNVQSEIWQRLAGLLENAGRSDDAKEVTRMAALRGVALEARAGQLPQPYARMYSQVQESIVNEDATGADMIARQCITLAERRGEKPDLIFTLNLVLGKVFSDAFMYDSAIRHLTVTARRGGAYIYPLAVCVAKSGDVDGGFTLLLDEIDSVPSAMPTLLPAILVLLAQIQPSEEIYERIDRLMNRIEKGERLTLRGVAYDTEEGKLRPIGTTWVQSRRIQSIVVRFPEKTDNFDTSAIQFISPEELAAESTAEEQ